jgi:hypothetical protein
MQCNADSFDDGLETAECVQRFEGYNTYCVSCCGERTHRRSLSSSNISCDIATFKRAVQLSQSSAPRVIGITLDLLTAVVNAGVVEVYMLLWLHCAHSCNLSGTNVA